MHTFCRAQRSKHQCWGFRTLSICFTLTWNFYFLSAKFFHIISVHAYKLRFPTVFIYIWKCSRFYFIPFISQFFRSFHFYRDYILRHGVRVYLFFIFHRVLSDTHLYSRDEYIELQSKIQLSFFFFFCWVWVNCTTRTRVLFGDTVITYFTFMIYFLSMKFVYRSIYILLNTYLHYVCVTLKSKWDTNLIWRPYTNL